MLRLFDVRSTHTSSLPNFLFLPQNVCFDANLCIMNMLMQNALRCVFGKKLKNMWGVQYKLLNQRKKILKCERVTLKRCFSTDFSSEIIFTWAKNMFVLHPKVELQMRFILAFANGPPLW